jgi:hypothetical protein
MLFTQILFGFPQFSFVDEFPHLSYREIAGNCRQRQIQPSELLAQFLPLSTQNPLEWKASGISHFDREILLLNRGTRLLQAGNVWSEFRVFRRTEKRVKRKQSFVTKQTASLDR